MSQKIDDAQGAAKAFEAYFLRRVLAEVQGENSIAGGGFAGGMFKEMMDEALADAMASGKGLGLSDQIVKQLDPDGTSSKATSSIASLDGTEPATILPQKVGRLPPRAGVLGPSAGQTLIAPLDGRASSSFGTRTDPIEGDRRKHGGLDLAAPEGTVVHAAGGGTVVHAGPAGTYGNLVVVDHGNGLETRYAHLQGVDVVKGAHIDRGEQVGRVGMTGRATGPHLHFEVRREGQTLDPADEISALKYRTARPNQ